jgi:hypothetical protein
VCGGCLRGEVPTSEAWRLDLAELRWERMLSLTRERSDHACCAVRGGVVVLGGYVEVEDESESEEAGKITVAAASVEILGFDSDAEESIFMLPPLSCGP